MKRMVSILLSVVLVLSMIPAAFAAEVDFKAATDNLYQLGLVSGTGTDANGDPIYELDRAPTRSEAITVLVKLLGKADEASKGVWNMPFTDVPGWAQSFVGYAYANGLTAGTSATTFGGNDLVTAAQYITFVLKALGYSANGDFQWDKAWELSDKLGITGGRYNADTTTFLRGDVFAISEAALRMKLKDSNQTLAEKLIAAGAFTRNQYNRVYGISMPELTSEQIFDKCSPAVFFVEVYDQAGRPLGTGSGFFLNSSGLAVTNHHVLDGAARAVITTSDTKQKYEVKGVYDFDEKNDWAVMQVDGTGFASLEIGSMDTVQGGATVFAIGSPIGLQNTISQGLISNPDRELDGVHYIQTSAPISHGSSGGALINKYGQVIGITSAGFTDGQNLNLAMPISVIANHDTSKLLPISAVTPKPSVVYELSKNSVSVEVGKSVLISMDVQETNIDAITYSVRSGDSSVATAVWDDMEDDYLPWDIRITGVRAGQTTLTISNNVTDDVVVVPIVVAAPKTGVAYQLSAQSVTLAVGEYKLISMDVQETNIDAITYSVRSGDSSIATVVWDDMEDDYLPWDIRITGVRAGQTTLTISNNVTNDVITIPIVVTAPASGRQMAAYRTLKNFVLSNYNETLGGDKAFEYVDGDFTYQLIYDAEYDIIIVREIFWGENTEYVSFVTLEAEGTTVLVTFYMYEPPYKDWDFAAARWIRAGEFHENSTAPFEDREGSITAKEEELLLRMSNLMILDSLDFVDIILQNVCESGYSTRDFGFTRI